MASIWQQACVAAALLGAGIYLVMRFRADRRRPKCHDCALGQIADKGRLPRR